MCVWFSDRDIGMQGGLELAVWGGGPVVKVLGDKEMSGCRLSWLQGVL